MATFQDVFNIEPNVAASLKTIIGAATGVTVLTAYEDTDKATPRIELRIELGPNLKHWGIDGNGNQKPDAWEARFTFRIVTNRKKPAQSQPAIRAKIRTALTDSTLFPSEAMPYHAVPYFFEEGSIQEVETEEDVDSSEMQYSGQIHIRPDVLATVVA